MKYWKGLYNVDIAVNCKLKKHIHINKQKEPPEWLFSYIIASLNAKTKTCLTSLRYSVFR